MHLATLKQGNAYGLAPTVAVLDDINAAESLARREAVLNEAKLNLPRFTPTEDWNGRSVLFQRSGALGDCLMVSPTLREIKKRWPDCKITFATLPQNKCILENNPDIDFVVSYPLDLDAFTRYDAYFVISDTINDGNPLTREKHAVDIILEMGGLETEDKELRYEITFEERSAAWARFPKGTRSRIGVQLQASAISRTWPKSHIAEFTKLAIKEGFEVFWFAQPGATGAGGSTPPPFLTVIDRENLSLSLRESIAVLSTCDAILAPDSLFCHLGGALGIPTIGLFASFPSSLRTSYAHSVKAIDGEPMRQGRNATPCNPCFHSIRPGQFLWPQGQPCSFSGRCEVLASITPEVVLKKLVRHLRKYVYKNGAS